MLKVRILLEFSSFLFTFAIRNQGIVLRYYRVTIKMKENNSIHIPSRRIELNTENGYVDWADYGAMALNVRKGKIELLCKDFISYFDKDKKYSVYVADNDFPTRNESVEMVQAMLNDSNFAKANKILFVLYHLRGTYPFAVVVENF
jgi:hypothetical protein